MTVTVVRYKTRPERADENQALIEKVFAELAADTPDGLRYASFRLEDGVTFVHIAESTTADGKNPLTEVAAFRAFGAEIADRCDEPPVALSGTMVGSYNFWPDD